MFRTGSVFLLAFALLLAAADQAGARIYLACDVGDCGPLQEGWISLGTCGLYENVGQTAVDIQLIQVGLACSCRGYFDENSGCPDAPCPAEGPLASVEQDFLFGDDQSGPPDADIILVFIELVPGADYRLTSYHNRLDETVTYIQGVQVSGATNVSAPGSIAQNHAIMENPAVVTFTAGTGNVWVRYVAPPGSQVFLNGFILEGGIPDVGFGEQSSAAVESSSTVDIPVRLSDAVGGQVTVDYAVTGGTAVRGDDFVLDDGTLTFAPGQTVAYLGLQVIGDGIDEEDETVELALSNPAGGVEMSTVFRHTHTIEDPRPRIGFVEDGAVSQETESPVIIEVALSHAAAGPVTVDYSVTGGTADRGVDYLLDDGTLTFETGVTLQNIAVEIIDDSLPEDNESVVLALSETPDAKIGRTTYLLVIIDPWAVASFEMFKIDLGCPGQPSTLKDGWTGWEVPGGCDGEPHDGRGISDVAGTGIDAYISLGGDSGGGNLISGSGSPICNTYYTYYSNEPMGAEVELTLSGAGLSAGEYWLYAYHNAPAGGWISSIAATGTGVLQIDDGGSFPIQNTSVDSLLDPSLVKFFTDGSGPVKLTYSAAGPNAVLNAFSLHSTRGPLVATSPSPADGSTGAEADSMLSWEPGHFAVLHDVFLGTDPDEVAAASDPNVPPGMGRVDVNSFDPSGLRLDTTYHWRIDEINPQKADSPWTGRLWSFTTSPCRIVDGFESYADTAAVLAAWTPTGGAALSLDEALSYAGTKSLRLDYDNTQGPSVSEAVMDFGRAVDLTFGGATAVGLFFNASAASTASSAYIAVEDSAGSIAAAYYAGQVGAEYGNWRPWGAPLGDLGAADVTSARKLVIGIEGGSGTINLDLVSLCIPHCLPQFGPAADIDGDCGVDLGDHAAMAADWQASDRLVPPADAGSANLTAWYRFENSADDSSGNGYHGVFFSPSGSVTPKWFAGAVGQSLFSLGDYGVRIASGQGPHPFSSVDSAVTVSFWIKRNADPAAPQHLVLAASDGPAGTVLVGIEADPVAGGMRFVTGPAGTDELIAPAPADWSGRWLHCAFVKDAAAGRKKIYIDGCAAAAAGGMFDGMSGATDATVAMTADFEMALVGWLDELRVYNRALSHEEIVGLMGGGDVFCALDSPANLQPAEPPNPEVIDFGDYAVLAGQWLQQTLWP
jgi:hypothetical protein